MGEFSQTLDLTTTLQLLTVSGDGSTNMQVSVVDNTGNIDLDQKFTLGGTDWLDSVGAFAFAATVPVSGESAQADIDAATAQGYFELRP
jgi:hypothetical protein